MYTQFNIRIEPIGNCLFQAYLVRRKLTWSNNVLFVGLPIAKPLKSKILALKLAKKRLHREMTKSSLCNSDVAEF